MFSFINIKKFIFYHHKYFLNLSFSLYKYHHLTFSINDRDHKLKNRKKEESKLKQKFYRDSNQNNLIFIGIKNIFKLNINLVIVPTGIMVIRAAMPIRSMIMTTKTTITSLIFLLSINFIQTIVQ